MSNIKILCIDDTPDEVIDTSNNVSLKQVLQSIYKSLPYKLIFEKYGEKGIEIAKNDSNIKLVLLDVEFKKQEKQGDKIAGDLLKVRPELKVIVLTKIVPSAKGRGRGIKISLGSKNNIIHYIVKKELSSPAIQEKLKNLSRAVINDYTNKNWTIRYDDIGVINLTNKQIKREYEINIPSTSEPALLECMKSPNKPVSLPTTYGRNLSRVHNTVNNNVREGTDWNTWGILTKEGCAKGHLKLLIGLVVPLPTSGTPKKDPYVTQSQFEKFMKEFERFKQEVLAKLEK